VVLVDLLEEDRFGHGDIPVDVRLANNGPRMSSAPRRKIYFSAWSVCSSRVFARLRADTWMLDPRPIRTPAGRANIVYTDPPKPRIFELLPI
jgi:hypothetical protein